MPKDLKRKKKERKKKGLDVICSYLVCNSVGELNDTYKLAFLEEFVALIRAVLYDRGVEAI